MKINLVKNGIFPTIYGKDGGIRKGTIGTIQGEGMYSGVPSLFIRTSGCNLRCAWKDKDGNTNICDTPYSSFFPEKNGVEIDDIIKIVQLNLKESNIKHIVITGGEPTLQKESLIELCKQLYELGYLITIETNGIIYIEELNDYVRLYSVSPKLKNSEPTEDKIINGRYNKNVEFMHRRKRINLETLKKYFEIKYYNEKCEVQFKFVVNDENDFREIDEIVDGLKKIILPVSYYDVLKMVYIMPEGITEKQLDRKWIVKECIKRGYNFTDRLHIKIFGNDRNY